MTGKRYRLIRYNHFLASVDTLDEAREIARKACADSAFADVEIHDDGEEAFRKYCLIETWRMPR